MKNRLNIALLEPFFTGSHKLWAEGLKKYSRDNIEIFSLPGKHWKWRMYGGAIKLAEQFLRSHRNFDLILATDMIDLNLFLSLTRKDTAHIPALIFFHENQLTYPWSSIDKEVVLKRDRHYGFINYSSALAADQIIFNSDFHKGSFLNALYPFLKSLPDLKTINRLPEIEKKSHVIYVGLDLDEIDKFRTQKNKSEAIRILWNHRWEEDKNPLGFYKFLRSIKSDFKLILLGERSDQCESLEKIENEFGDRILSNKYCDSLEEYIHWLCLSDIQVVTSNQDFFGISIVEAMQCGVIPILPDRLSYKELIPKDLVENLTYKRESDILHKISKLGDKDNISKSLIKYIDQFNWKNIIEKYDTFFEETNLKS